MRDYLLGHLSGIVPASLQSTGVLVAFWAIWAHVQEHFSGFPGSDSVFWMSVVWGCDFALGSLIALGNSWKVLKGTATEEERKGRWSPARVARSVVKWAAWFIILILTYGVRQNGHPHIADLVECAIYLHEGSSAFRNAGIITGARWLSAIAKAGEDGAERTAEAVAQEIAKIGNTNGKVNHELPPTSH